MECEMGYYSGEICPQFKELSRTRDLSRTHIVPDRMLHERWESGTNPTALAATRSPDPPEEILGGTVGDGEFPANS
jgi:hypothetical protein